MVEVDGGSFRNRILAAAALAAALGLLASYGRAAIVMIGDQHWLPRADASDIRDDVRADTKAQIDALQMRVEAHEANLNETRAMVQQLLDLHLRPERRSNAHR